MYGASLVAQRLKHLPPMQIPWSRKWYPTPVILSEESHGQRSLVGYRPWGHKELDRLNTHTHFFELIFELSPKE